MNIKQTEAETGLTRANIRYYEKEGLLSPARESNGYRDYSSEDVLTLSRIKLLRQLDIPVETIRQLQSGQIAMQPVIDRQLNEVEKQKKQLDDKTRVLKDMKQDQVAYGTLDAKTYLDRFDHPKPAAPTARITDGEAHTPHPWRRYFARGLDISLYELIFEAVLYLGFGMHPLNENVRTIVLLIAGVVMTLLLEPLLLHFFGTTPGKCLFGIFIEDNDGKRLSLSLARERTKGVLFSGEGLCLPGLMQWRNWKSYKDYCEGYQLSWEYDSQLYFKDTKTWRGWGYIAATALIAASAGLLALHAQLPIHRGALTTAQFAENYTDLMHYHGYYENYRLDEDLNWVEIPQPGSVIIYATGDPIFPVFTVTEENGQVVSIKMEASAQNTDSWIASYDNDAFLAYLSFAGAQKPLNPLAFWLGKNTEPFKTEDFTDFSFTQNGIAVSCSYETVGYGYTPDSSLLIPPDGADTRFSWVFTMEKIR